MVSEISTGIRYLDQVSGGLRLGDNVVWEISSGVPVEYFIKAFFAEKKDFRNTVIIISCNASPYTVQKRYSFLMDRFKVILVDAFTRGKGNGDPVFLDFYQEKNNADAVLLENPRDQAAFMKALNEIESGNKDGSFYLFDSLTGMMELWKDEAAVLDFFNFTCPKLYDLNTLAYWILERDAHSKEFLAGLVHTTQVVFSLSPTRADHFKLTIKKLQGRASAGDQGPHLFTLSDGSISFREKKHEGMLGIGDRVKELRRQSGMTQTELASRIDMTPGAVSQIENEITVPSLNTLLQLSSIFGKPVDFFLGNEKAALKKNYSLLPSTAPVKRKESGINVTTLAEPGDLEFLPHLVSFDAGAAMAGPLFLHKGNEVVTVISGSVTVTVDGEKIFLERRQTLRIASSFPEQWEAGAEGCELYYILMQR